MRAAQIHTYGDATVIALEDINIPEFRDDQVLVEVRAASINPFDTTIRSGVMKDTLPLNLPFTLGGDFAGIVHSVGADVKSVAVGDHVYGQANVVSRNSGAFAEYAATASINLARMPSKLDYAQAASLPLVGASALQALTTHLQVKPRQRLFIHGGAGGIGSIAIQIAKNLGAYVATTATGESTQYVRELGADEVIDYKTKNFCELLRGFDAVFDTVGGEDFARSLHVLKPGGSAVSMIANPDNELAAMLGVSAIMQQTRVTTEVLDELTRLVESSAITPQIDTIYPLDRIREAFKERESGHVNGKIVLNVR